MGQLEKYGLYVLCLVIFLILGVTIWGGDGANTPKQRNPAVSIRANPMPNGGAGGNTVHTSPNGSAPNGVASNALARSNGGNYIDSLLGPVTQPVANGNGTAGNAGPAASGANRTPEPLAGNGNQSDPVGSAPPGPAAGGTAVASTVEYRIKSGDTLGDIARSQLGSTRFVARILELNPGVDPKRLQIGKKLTLPPRNAPKAGGAAKPDALARSGAYRLYTVSKGDNFERIARAELGSPRRVTEILGMNANVDPKRLRIGQKIKLPLK